MITRSQIRAALGLLNMTVTEFATATEVPSQNAISRYLRDPSADMRHGNLVKIKERFEELGIEFLADNGVRLRIDD